MAWEVGLSSARLPTRAVRAAPSSSSVWPAKGASPSTCMVPSVMVPVLSKHRVSTRARVSMQYMSCTRVLRAESLMTLTAKARLMRSTSPSGIMPTMAAAVLTTEFWKVSWSTKYCFQNSRPPMGRMAKPMIFTIKSMESMISEFRFLMYPASPAIFWA